MTEYSPGVDRDTPAMDHRLLTFFFGAAVLLYLSVVLAYGRPAVLQALGGGIAVLLVVAWIAWSRRPSTVTAAGFAVVAFAAFLIADSPVSIATQWMALIVLTLGTTRGVALIYGAVTLAVTAATHVAAGSGLGRILGESLATVLIVLAGLSFASLLLRARTLDESRRRALTELAEANSRLQASLRDSRDLALAQERERVAAALHDGLGHQLTTIGLSLDFSRRMIDRDPARAAEEITRAREATSTALDTMRATVRAMRPTELAEGGIHETLASLADSFRGTGLTVTFRSAAGPEPDEATTLLILRTVQEALTNAVRHSGADRVEITLSPTSLTVADNGRGNDAAPSFGLTSLSDRAHATGGELSLAPHGGPDGGFLLTLTLPELP